MVANAAAGSPRARALAAALLLGAAETGTPLGAVRVVPQTAHEREVLAAVLAAEQPLRLGARPYHPRFAL